MKRVTQQPKRQQMIGKRWGERWAGLALAAALAGWPGMAAAGPVGSASITQLTFTLIDLDQNDGVGPSLQWASAYGFTQVDRQYGQVVTLFPQGGGLPQWSASFSLSDPTALSESFSFLDVLNAALGGGSASTDAGGLSAGVAANAGESLNAFAYGSGSFLLSANTELRVSATLTTHVAGPGSAGFQGPAGVDPAFAVPYAQSAAYAELYLEGQSALSTVDGLSYTPHTPLTLGTLAYAGDDEQVMELVLRNDSAADFMGGFYALVQASAMELENVNVQQPVPEPDTLPLVLWGLAAAGLGARCRRR